jgi:hypothetical protein
MEVFWSDSIYVLYKNDKLKQFFPKKNMTLEERLNSIVRLSLYISVIVALYSKNYQYIYIFFIALILTYLIYKNRYNAYNDYFLDYTNNLVHKYIEPTKNNPFMNISLDDYSKNPNRESISKKKNVNKEIQNKFNIDLYKDFSDVFEKQNSQRQFYTTPVTTIPNKQNEFAKWLYGKDKSCKEGNPEQCVKNIYSPLYNRVGNNRTFKHKDS